MSSRRARSLLCLVLLIAGCDKTPTTAPGTASQAITGQVISQEFNIEVSAWQAHLVRSTTADSAGYFSLNNLPVGVYEVRLTAPSGRHLSIKGVSIETERTTSLREIRLSPPTWPLWDVQPADSSKGVPPLAGSIRVTTTMPLDLSSLQSEVTLTPTVEGLWQFDSYFDNSPYSAYYYYQFLVSGYLDVATKYTLHFGPGLKLAGGQPWGDSLDYVFFTDSLRLLSVRSLTYNGYNFGLVQPRRDFSLYAQFNAQVNADSLTRATSFTPSIQGVWLSSPLFQDARLLQFFHTEEVGLRAEQTYRLNISRDVPLAGSAKAAGNLSVIFRTEPLLIVASFPQQGQFEFCSSCRITLRFNSEMDTTSVGTAFSLHTLHGAPVTGTREWNNLDEMAFIPDSSLTSGEVYLGLVSPVAASLWGDHLKEPFDLYFRVR